jgi:hypothetical protein
MSDLAVLDMPALLDDLEPSKVVHGFVRTADSLLDRVLNSYF